MTFNEEIEELYKKYPWLILTDNNEDPVLDRYATKEDALIDAELEYDIPIESWKERINEMGQVEFFVDEAKTHCACTMYHTLEEY